jgi:hypothetical protein
MRYIRRLPLYDIHILVILIYVYRLLIYDVHNMNVNIYIYMYIYICRLCKYLYSAQRPVRGTVKLFSFFYPSAVSR